jgi:hypothetical protein
MSRARSPLLLSLPLVLTGSALAHSLAYGLVEPDAQARGALLRASGHAYLQLGSLAAAAACALLVVAMLRHAALVGRRGRASDPPPLLFALLPPIVFALQEHLERLLHTGEVPFAAALEPTFLVGLLLQLPFALVAYAAARALLRASEWLGAPASPPAVATAGPPALVSVSAQSPPRRPLASGHAQRGPPRPGRPRS